jgi:hypothetical protein
MTARILPQAVALSLFVCAARAADPAVAPDAGAELEVIAVEPVGEPVIIACPGLPTEDGTIFTSPVVDEPFLIVCPEPIFVDNAPKPIVVDEPIVIVCPGAITGDDSGAIEPEVGEPEVVTCEGIEGEVTEVEVVDVRHYTGSEVERGDGEVDPSLMYTTGVNTLGGPATGATSFDQDLSTSGIEIVAALKVDIADHSAPARELKVLAAAGDIIISD